MLCNSSFIFRSVELRKRISLADIRSSQRERLSEFKKGKLSAPSGRSRLPEHDPRLTTHERLNQPFLTNHHQLNTFSTHNTLTTTDDVERLRILRRGQRVLR